MIKIERPNQSQQGMNEKSKESTQGMNEKQNPQQGQQEQQPNLSM